MKTLLGSFIGALSTNALTHRHQHPPGFSGHCWSRTSTVSLSPTKKCGCQLTQSAAVPCVHDVASPPPIEAANAVGGKPSLGRSDDELCAVKSDGAGSCGNQHLPALDEVLSTHTPLMDHAPRGARVQSNEALTDASNSFAATPFLGSYTVVNLLL